jgi:UDP-N-acetylmuramate dehydrogenase
MSYLDEIKSIDELEYHQDIDLTSYTTFRLKSRGNLIKVFSLQALREILSLFQKFKKKYLVIGWGANQILPSECDKEILLLDFPFDKNYLNTVRDEYEFPASVGLNILTSHAVKFGLKGWEVFTGIPASLGGAVYMNAGTNLGEMSSLVTSVTLMNGDGFLREVSITKESFSYRRNYFVEAGEVIVSVKLKHFGQSEEISSKIKNYLEYRRSSQPLSTKNCGCVFKNPLDGFQAGRLIDLIGLKNLKSGDLQVSPKHANFMENSGNANLNDFSTVVNTIRFYMNTFYGLEFELEVKIPYDF